MKLDKSRRRVDKRTDLNRNKICLQKHLIKERKKKHFKHIKSSGVQRSSLNFIPTKVNEFTTKLIIKSAKDTLNISIYVDECKSLLTIIAANIIKLPLN